MPGTNPLPRPNIWAPLSQPIKATAVGSAADAILCIDGFWHRPAAVAAAGGMSMDNEDANRPTTIVAPLIRQRI
ncbi:hypothetical protein GCM10022629_66880 [Amorphoplanes auranticolor]